MHLKMSSGKWRPSCLGLNVFNGPRSGHLRHIGSGLVGLRAPEILSKGNDLWEISLGVLELFCKRLHLGTTESLFRQYKNLIHLCMNE